MWSAFHRLVEIWLERCLFPVLLEFKKIYLNPLPAPIILMISLLLVNIVAKWSWYYVSMQIENTTYVGDDEILYVHMIRNTKCVRVKMRTVRRRHFVFQTWIKSWLRMAGQTHLESSCGAPDTLSNYLAVILEK